MYTHSCLHLFAVIFSWKCLNEDILPQVNQSRGTYSESKLIRMRSFIHGFLKSFSITMQLSNLPHKYVAQHLHLESLDEMFQ